MFYCTIKKCKKKKRYLSLPFWRSRNKFHNILKYCWSHLPWDVEESSTCIQISGKSKQIVRNYPGSRSCTYIDWFTPVQKSNNLLFTFCKFTSWDEVICSSTSLTKFANEKSKKNQLMQYCDLYTFHLILNHISISFFIPIIFAIHIHHITTSTKLIEQG